MDVRRVIFNKKAKKDLVKLPESIIDRLLAWVEMIEEQGLNVVREIKGFHDEPLKGKRRGQRLIRLNRAYRVIYIQYDYGVIELNYVGVMEVNKHVY